MFLKTLIFVGVIFLEFLWITCQVIDINVCENVADNIFVPDINNCSKYFVCIDGEAKTQQCRSNLYFDASLQACIASRRNCLQCPKGQVISVALAKTCDKYIYCFYGLAYLRRCKSNQQFNPKLGKCDLAKNVDCVANHCSIHKTENNLTYVASAASCANYYVCLEGHPKLFTCDSGLYFNTECNCCENKENVECLTDEMEKMQYSFTVITEIPNIKCPQTGSFLYSHSQNNRYYYTCVDGKATLLACTSGFVFDNSVKRCIQKVTADRVEVATQTLTLSMFTCPDGFLFDANINACTTISIAKDIYHPIKRTEFINIICSNIGAFIFPNNLINRHYLCIDNKAYILDCVKNDLIYKEMDICPQVSKFKDVIKKNTHATEHNQISMFNENAVVAEFTSNNKCPKSGTFIYTYHGRNQYYMCINGNAIRFECPGGHLFDAKINACRANSQTENSKMSSRTFVEEPVNIMCPSKGTFTYAHLKKNKFYLCIDGMASVFDCIEGSIFDEKAGVCREIPFENYFIAGNKTQGVHDIFKVTSESVEMYTKNNTNHSPTI